MNSSLFYGYFVAYGDCFHLSDTLVGKFPVPSAMVNDKILEGLGRTLNARLKKSATPKTIRTRDGSEISYAEFRVADCKQILDDIDECMAGHYGFTSKELEFFKNYDIKYRMGQDESGDDE